MATSSSCPGRSGRRCEGRGAPRRHENPRRLSASGFSCRSVANPVGMRGVSGGVAVDGCVPMSKSSRLPSSDDGHCQDPARGSLSRPRRWESGEHVPEKWGPLFRSRTCSTLSGANSVRPAEGRPDGKRADPPCLFAADDEKRLHDPRPATAATMNTAIPPGRTMPRDSPLGRVERGGYGMGSWGRGFAGCVSPWG